MIRMTVRALRVNKGLTQSELAKMLGVNKKTVGAWENGKSMPSLDKVEPLCSILGVKYDDVQWNV